MTAEQRAARRVSAVVVVVLGDLVAEEA